MRLSTPLLLLLILPFACAVGAPSELTEAEKRERIDILYEGYRADFPTVPEITVDDLRGRLSGSDVPVLIDVRAEEEQRVSILPGAISREEF